MNTNNQSKLMIKTTFRNSDFFFFFTIFISVFFLWSIVMFVPISSLFGTGDTISLVAHYADMLKAGPLASNYLYTNTRLGGATIGPLDMPVYFQLFSAMRLHPLLAINFSILLSQSVLVFFSLKTLEFLGDKKIDNLLALFFMVIIAFNPAIAWRVVYGHLNLIWGVLWGLSLIYLCIAFFKNNLSYTGIFLSLIVLSNSLQCINLAQPILYVALVALLVLLVYIKNIKILLPALISFLPFLILVVFVSALYSLVNIANVISFVPSLGRVTSESVIYSYTTQVLQDYIASLFYSFKSFSVGRDFFHLHETNLGYGFFPVLFLCLFVKFRKYKWTWFILFLFITGVVLSSNLKYLSDALLWIFPVLKKFRCPSRIFLIINHIFALTLCWLVIKSKPNIGKTIYLLNISLFFFLSAFFSMFDLSVDYLYVPFAIVATMLIFWRINIVTKHIMTFVSVFAAINLLGFKDKLPTQLIDIDSYRQGEEIMSTLPDLPNTLLEHAATTVYSPFGVSQAAVYNYSGVDGYIYPTRRFLDLYRSLRPGVSEHTNAFEINSNYPDFNFFTKIFNITKEIRLEKNVIKLVNIKDNNPMFSPSTVIFTDDVKETISGLKHHEGIQTGYIETIYQRDFNSIKPCNEFILSEHDNRYALIKLKTNNTCLIILTTSFTPFFKARTGEGHLLKVLPVNWTMTGVLIPPMDGTIAVETRPALEGEYYFKLFSIILLFLGMIFKNKLLAKRI